MKMSDWMRKCSTKNAAHPKFGNVGGNFVGRESLRPRQTVRLPPAVTRIEQEAER